MDFKPSPEVESLRERIEARHKILKQSKLDFRSLIIAAGIVDPKLEKGDPPKAEKPWWLAVAPGAAIVLTGLLLSLLGDDVARRLVRR